MVAPRTSETAHAFLMVSDSVFFEPRSVSAASDSLLAGSSRKDAMDEALQSRIRIRKIKSKKVARATVKSDGALKPAQDNAIAELGEESHSSAGKDVAEPNISGELTGTKSVPTLLVAMKNKMDSDVASFNKSALKRIKVKQKDPLAATESFSDLNYAGSMDKLRRRDHEIRTRKLIKQRMERAKRLAMERELEHLADMER